MWGRWVLATARWELGAGVSEAGGGPGGCIENKGQRKGDQEGGRCEHSRRGDGDRGHSVSEQKHPEKRLTGLRRHWGEQGGGALDGPGSWSKAPVTMTATRVPGSGPIHFLK